MEASRETSQVALITGGASGMGLEVAKALSRRGGWSIHCLDLKGQDAIQQVRNATFHKTNVLDYDALGATFQKVFDLDHRLDFVFANAGIVERFSFYATHPTGTPPPPPDQTVSDINFKSVVTTSWLAQHYLRQSKSDNKNLVMTASCGGLYKCVGSPIYTGTKHGVVGFMRSIAPRLWKHDQIRVNAICPGTVRTGLLNPEAWDTFPPEVFVPIEKIAEVVLMLIDGHDIGGKEPVTGKPFSDATNGSKRRAINGTTEDDKLWGRSVILSGKEHYYQGQPEYCDQTMELTMSLTDRDSI